MKKLLCVALLVPTVAFAAQGKQSSASEGLYGRFDLGMDLRKSNKVNDIKIKSNKTAVAGFGVGYQLNEYFSTDLNLQFRNLETVNKSNSSDKIKNGAATMMLNGNLSLPTNTMFTPYATAGLGWSNIAKSDNKDSVSMTATSFSASSSTKNSTSLAWNAGLGVKTKIQDNISLDVGYKFVNVGKIKYEFNNDKKTSKIQAHEITAGVIVSF